jgi:tRNA nucleotidyltransferase/poly(A) polymerase
VRDRFLGISPHDYDIATTATPDEVQELFRSLPSPRVKVVPTGVAHGTVTLVYQHHPFQVTTLRQDIAHHGRRATVQFNGSSFEDDAARRDFTMNAMSEDSEGRIFDYFSGQEHLKQRKIVFIGSPAARIREDYLRILRFYRFKARFNLHADTATAEAIATLAAELANISKERVTMEMLALLETSEVTKVLEEMAEAGIFAVILPELAGTLVSTNFSRLAKLIPSLEVLEKTLRPCAQFASWLYLHHAHDVTAITSHIVLSNTQRSCLSWALKGFRLLPELGESQAALFTHLDHSDSHCGRGNFLAFLLPLWQRMSVLAPQQQHKKIRSILAQLDQLETHKSQLRLHFPLSGKDIAQWTGLDTSPLLGKILSQLKESYRNEVWRTRDEAMLLCRELASRHGVKLPE